MARNVIDVKLTNASYKNIMMCDGVYAHLFVIAQKLATRANSMRCADQIEGAKGIKEGDGELYVALLSPRTRKKRMATAVLPRNYRTRLHDHKHNTLVKAINMGRLD